ncbi:MAG TPA: ABC transporter ATP-binding protein [Jatrophihabitans sp.]|nr:ABC transporter ATP-binding protein [Jatrophihabitans sp.]
MTALPTSVPVLDRTAAALSVRGLSVEFRGRQATVHAVSELDLDIAAGELMALLGESGSGKSVTARAVMGLHRGSGVSVRADSMLLDGVDLLTQSDDQLRSLRGDKMSMVFQDALSALNPVLTIGDQIGELFRTHRGANRRQAREQAAELLAMVGIPDPKNRVKSYPHQFSGGMRQRLLIAMAIALEPQLLIADEPTTALDVTVQAQILELIDRLRTELNMAVLLITHDLGVVCEIADRVTVMYGGRVVERCSADALFDRPAHPYTEALLNSVPQSGSVRSDLPVIPGSPPSLSNLPPGCSFHPRCGWAIPRCAEERPELRSPGRPNRESACHRAEEVLHV